MRKSILAIILLGGGFWASMVAAYFFPVSIADLAFPLGAFALLTVLFLTAIYAGLARDVPLRNLLAIPILCAIFLSGMPAWGVFKAYVLDDWLFLRELPKYMHIVDEVKNGAIPTDRGVRTIDHQFLKLPIRVGKVFAASCSRRTAVVEFHILSGGGAVGPHGGYLFNDCADPATRAIVGKVYDKRYGLYRIRDSWYEFGN